MNIERPPTSKAVTDRGPRPQGRWGRRALLCAASVIAALLLAETVVRLFGLGPPVYAPRRFEPRGGVPFALLAGNDRSLALPARKVLVYRPNTTFASVYDTKGDARGYFGPEGRVEYGINRFGLRGPDIPLQKEPRTLRVLCLGDSFTFGEGVRYEDTYPARLQRLLSETGEYANIAGKYANIDVINAGVQGYGTHEEVAFYALQGYQFAPDVVLLGFVLNDATDFAETIRQNEAMTKEQALSWPGRISRLWEMLERSRRERQLQEEFFATTRASFRSPRWEECQELLKNMTALSHERRFRFVVVIFPIFTGLESGYPFANLHESVRAACREAGCECVDLLDVYRGRPSASLWVHPTDQHPNEIAHRLAAERIAAYLATGGVPHN